MAAPWAHLGLTLAPPPAPPQIAAPGLGLTAAAALVAPLAAPPPPPAPAAGIGLAGATAALAPPPAPPPVVAPGTSSASGSSSNEVAAGGGLAATAAAASGSSSVPGMNSSAAAAALADVLAKGAANGGNSLALVPVSNGTAPAAGTATVSTAPVDVLSPAANAGAIAGFPMSALPGMDSMAIASGLNHLPGMSGVPGAVPGSIPQMPAALGSVANPAASLGGLGAMGAMGVAPQAMGGMGLDALAGLGAMGGMGAMGMLPGMDAMMTTMASMTSSSSSAPAAVGPKKKKKAPKGDAAQGDFSDMAALAAAFAGQPTKKKAKSADAAAAAAAMAMPGASGETGEEQMAVWAAAAEAQQQQYLQQYQFYQQLRAQEAQKAKETGGVVASQESSRFKEGFRPMRICKHLITFGICRQGAECTFGHTYEELHPASPDLPDVPKDEVQTTALAEQSEVPESAVPDMRLKKKKEMCGRYSRGECFLGKICPFAHSEDQLGTVGLAVCGKVKTRLCVFWDAKTQTAKGCIYGSNCNNAHGDHEIGMKRPPPELAPPMKRRKDGQSVIAGKD